MKNDFTRRNRRLALRAVKLKVTRAGYVLLAGVMLCMAFAALQPLSAADDVGNAKQAIGHQLYFGNFPQNYEGWNTLVEAAMATVPHVKKINYRAQAPKTPDGRDSFYVGFFSVQPVEWRVLADDAEGILLLSEQILTQWPYHTSGGPVTWQGASVRDSLKYRFLLGNTLLGGGKDYFSPTEIDAVATSTLQNPKIGVDPDGITTQDSVFLLSAADSSLYFSNAADRIATNTQYVSSFRNTSDPGIADYWLLRTHSGSLFEGLVMWVREQEGYIDRTGVSNSAPALIRPALRISRDRFVMLSNSKPATLGVRSNSLTNSVTGTLKLTLVDNSLDLTVGGASDYMDVTSGNDLTGLTYTVSSGGPSDYISVLVEDQGGDVVYYTKLVAVTSAATNQTLPNIPFNTAGITSGAYTVKIFHEQVNASVSEPDLASAPKVISVGIASSAALPDITTVEGTADDLSDGWTDIPYNDTVRFTGDPLPVLSVTGNILSGYIASLPPGLTLEPTGILHGTPSTAGNYSFTVQALNGSGPSTKTYQVEIGASSAPVITDPAPGLIDSVLRNISVNVDTVEATGGPAPTFSISAGKLPIGMFIDAATGRIYGIPTKEETAHFTVMAGNPLGNDYRDYSIKVKISNNPVAPTFITPAGARPPALANRFYSDTIVAVGEPAPTFIVQSGNLPSGLALDPATGIIEGTPTATSPVASPYTFTIKANSGGLSATQTFTLVVNYVLEPPHLTLTPPVPTAVGSDPFSVTATFDVPVSGLLPSKITVTGGTASNLVPTGTPTATLPPRYTTWTFDVTPASGLTNGSVIEAYIEAGAALDEHNAATYAESDTVKAVFQYDQPVVQFSLASGTAYLSDPGTLSFDVIPNGVGAGAGDVFVGSVPASDANIADVIEITRDGVPHEDWEASISGTHVTINGVFGQGEYEVAVKPNQVGNNIPKFAPQTLVQFTVQISANWYEGCLNTFTLPYPLSPTSRSLLVSYSGLTDYLTGADGSPTTAVTLPAGQTDVTFSFRTLAVPDELEGDSVAIIIADPLTLIPTTYWIKLYNRPKVEDVIYIPATTRYPGYFKLLKGGSPTLRRSFDAGQHWSNAWGAATNLELADAAEEIILREPDGCYSIHLTLDVSISATIRRSIFLPTVANIVVTSGAGEHSVFSGADFVFQVAMTGPLANRRPLVTTDRRHVPDSVGVVVEPNEDGTFSVRLRAVREPVHVSLAAGELLTGNAAVETTQVWTSDGQLYISSVANDEAKVYTLTGALLKSVAVAAGQTVRTDLPPGCFVVRLDRGRTFKVSGF